MGALVQLAKRRGKRLFGHYYPGFYDFDYARWRRQRAVSTNADINAFTPRISIIVPVYNVDEKWLLETLQSVFKQSYQNWQLCLINDGSALPHVREILDRYPANDKRVVVRHNEKNLGISHSSNIGLEMADGEFIALLDHDDLLAVDALREIVAAINAHPQADFFYSDEDKVDSHGQFSTPFFKPGFSPELLTCQNYIGHLVVIRHSLISRLGGFREKFDGAQDYDLVLRATAAARQVIHIPKVLYHWRQIAGSTALIYGEKEYAWHAGQLALEDFHRARESAVTVQKGKVPGTYRTRYVITENPAVSVIVPFRDRPDLLDQCLTSVVGQTGWKNLEIIGIDNRSKDPATSALKTKWQAEDSRVQFFDYDHDFNYSAICNFGAGKAGGDYIVLLNNDVEITTEHWVESLLQYARNEAIGAVGAVLHYPDKRIQHAGIVVGIGGSAGHPFKTFPDDSIGYFARLTLTSNVSAVTGALLMVSKSKYLQVGGLDETSFAVALNDVDFCLKLSAAGYRNIVTASCCGIHDESASRGTEYSGTRLQRYEKEVRRFRDKWTSLFEQGDPYYNSNLTLESEDYTLRWPAGN